MNNVAGSLKLFSEIDNFSENQFQCYIDKASNFIKSNTNIDINELPVDIIISKNIKETAAMYTSLSFATEAQAITINRFQLNGVIRDREIVIIDWGSCCSLGTDYFISILVHEFIHCVDFQKIDTISTLFKISLYRMDNNYTEFENVLNFFFRSRTEMRAFYYDEIYLCEHGLFTDNIDQVKIITDEDRNLSFILPRLIGKIKCWKEKNIHIDKVLEAEKYIETLTKFGDDWCVNFRNAFSFDHFVHLCKEIKKYY